jgi:hypothetical protein
MSPGSVDVPDVLCVHKEVLDGLDPEVELLVLLDPRRVVAGGSAPVLEAEQAPGVLLTKSSKGCFPHF